MGDTFESIVDVEVADADAPRLAEEMVAWLVGANIVTAEHVAWNRVTTEGLEVWTRRSVFYSLTGEQTLGCPSCGWSEQPEHTDVMERIGEWHDGGADLFTCPHCDRRAGLNEWQWSPPWGFGCLGFTFWPGGLTPEFLSTFTQRLGHRTVHPYGKL